MIEAPDAYGVAERAARESYGKLLAYLSKRCGDVDAAEDALADAFTAALQRWPGDGVPRVPEAWLLVAARRRLEDRARRESRAGRLHDRLGAAALEAERTLERTQELGDERLGLLFACAHPAIAAHVHAPLMLQAVLGFDAARIASAFLVAPATMSQRLVRAKAKIAASGIPLSVPAPDELPQRLEAVLAAIYAAFAAGSDARDAIWLGRVLAELRPDEPEVLGLLSLMLHAEARRAAGRDANGAYVALDEQDVARWDGAAIAEAEALLERAARARRIGRFQLEAAIQSAHAARRENGTTNWPAILALYDGLLKLTDSPVVALNRAVALGRVHGPRAGLDALAPLADDERLQSYQPYWAARAELYARAERRDEARAAYERALGLPVDPALRRYLAGRMR